MAKSPAGGTGKYAGLTASQKWAKNPHHTIPFATHQQNAAAKKALGTLDLTAPPTAGQALTEANSAADLQYGPQVHAAQQLQANVDPWFRDYQARVAGYAIAAQQQANPVLAQATAYQQGAAGQVTPGLDPNSDAGKQAAQAAQGRQALSQLGLDALTTNSQATQDYFTGQQAMAQKVLPQQQAAATQNVANAQSQRGAAVQGFLTTARQNAQNYAIARGTLGLNTAKAESDAAAADANVTEKNRHNVASETNTANKTAASQQAAADKAAAKGAAPNKYGVPNDQFAHWSTSHRQRVINAFNEKSANGANDKDAAKHAADVHTATGKVENKITDIIGAWNGYVGTEIPDTTKPITKNGQPVKGPDGKPTYQPKKVSADDIKSYLAQDHKDWAPQLIHIALLRRANPPKPLDQASIDYLHNLDPNFRIPRGWLPSGYGQGGRKPGDTSPPAGRDTGGK